MAKELDFESIRPYKDHEIQQVFERLKKETSFLELIGFLYPELSSENFINKMMQIKSIRQFQQEVISPYVREIIKNTTKGVTSEGLDKLDPNESYLYISNHRDIVLDPAILNVIMFEHGFDTTEIAIGDNLLIYPWITDLVKLNRTFIVKRNLPVRQMMESSTLLSKYIRNTLTEVAHSIWIAQREGRSKDGNDRTQLSLLKMLNISGEDESVAENFKKLKIVPVSISYEYDPCDYLKALEFQHKRDNPDYAKTQDDDLKHMGAGLRGRKGRVHFAFGDPIDKELDKLKDVKNKNEKFEFLAGLIDTHVHENYHLWPGNWVAWDMLNKTDEYKDQYTEDEKEVFLNYIEEHLDRIDGDRNFLRKMLLEMYANPVVNKREILGRAVIE
ncbi:1-acyl-sn-glycerol-3-phosphate acyltransferase [Marinilabilia rubra]|uniref:Glycerol acyltransferase n=1 Tax=Marinilabilia rubra TaxID=2162893 RepID=A0A2U2BEA4_9BACT|nr:1-acyl-sn-glycerol-3-phosphate acyltransferase [Marinilabilia rubra]PWE01392.1 glycerol acyltransferase [Marinilabilia rubra]